MRRYLFDTNIISDLIKNPASNMVLKVFDLPQDTFCTSVIVACELRYGAHKKESKKLSDRVDLILNEFDVLPLSNDVISYYAELRTFLERKGQVIGANDLLIASHSLAIGVTLITANIGEFSRVPNLKVENWLD